MFHLHSIAGRVAIGGIIGIVMGLIIMLISPSLFSMPVLSMFGLGSLIMFLLMGAFIGLVGIFDRHPVFEFKMNWWIRGIGGGAIFMLMYILLSYETIELVLQSDLISSMGFKSPFWAMIDGICIGLIMSFLEMKFAGDGKNLPAR